MTVLLPIVGEQEHALADATTLRRADSSGRAKRFSMTLQRLTDVVVLLLAVTLMYTFVVRKQPSSWGSAPGSPYKTGDIIEDSPKLRFSTAKRTLVLETVSTCGYCAKSMPFFSRLVDAAHRVGGTQVVAVSKDPVARHVEYLNAHGLQVDAGESGVKYSVTPFVILTDQRGRVLGAWRGLPSPEQEIGMMRAVTQ
jgi:hypothetical protein